MTKFKLLFFFSLFLLIGQLQAQNTTWVNSGAQWHYDFSLFTDRGYAKITYVGDILYQGKSCKILERSLTTSNTITNPAPTTNIIDSVFTYASNDSVFYWRNNSFRLLYAFNAQLGDSIIMDGIKAGTVDSVGTMMLNGESLRFIRFNPNTTATYQLRGIVVEKIGAIESYMFPRHNVDAHLGDDFRCYQDDSLGRYPLASSDSLCEYIAVGTNIVETENPAVINWSIFPNPVSSKMTLKLEDNSFTEGFVDVYNLQGQLLKYFEIRENISELDLDELSRGTYFVRIRYNKRQAFKKFVKLK